MRARRAPRPLTSLQAQVLGCIGDGGPCDSFEIDRNLRLGVERARRVASALEERGLIGRDYTSRRYDGRFGYVITTAGREQVQEIYGRDEEGKRWDEE